MNPAIATGLAAAGIDSRPEIVRRLELLAGWLRTEAMSAGAVGPAEGGRIEERHLADSLAFAAAWTTPPIECWDLGSGAGLPGLVLAIVWPGTAIRLVDRSKGRCRLARRASRLLDLEVKVVEGDIERLAGKSPAIVSRATMPAHRLAPILSNLLAPGGQAVVSGDGQPVSGFEGFDVEILDRVSRLLIMRAP